MLINTTVPLSGALSWQTFAIRHQISPENSKLPGSPFRVQNSDLQFHWLSGIPYRQLERPDR